MATANALANAGFSFDIGLAQINSANVRKLGLNYNQAFDPCTNLRIGSYLLSENYARAIKRYPEPNTALHHALSAYNTGNMTSGLKNGYVAKVLGNYALPMAIPASKRSINPTKN